MTNLISAPLGFEEFTLYPVLKELMRDEFPYKKSIIATNEKFPRLRVYGIGDEEKTEKVVIEATLAGYPIKDVLIEVDESERVISFSYNKKEEKDVDEKVVELYNEIKTSSFKRIVKAPDYGDLKNIKTSYEDGIYKIEIPILEEKPNVRRLTI